MFGLREGGEMFVILVSLAGTCSVAMTGPVPKDLARTFEKHLPLGPPYSEPTAAEVQSLYKFRSDSVHAGKMMALTVPKPDFPQTAVVAGFLSARAVQQRLRP